MNRKLFNIYLVGVGGQGILTVGELIAQAAVDKNIPANFYPTKGMAQRGGFVKAQLRLGREMVGPNIPEKGADLVIAMELSESLKAIRYLKPGGDFVLFGHIWAPTAVTLGKAAYPTREQVFAQVKAADGRMCYVDPRTLPDHEGATVPENVYVLGIALGHTALRELFTPEDLSQALRNRWKRGAQRNALAFKAGLEGEVKQTLASVDRGGQQKK